MQLNIGIVEDDSVFLKELSSYIRLWEKRNYCQVEIFTYLSCESFQAEEKLQFDLIFMDIELQDGNGVKLAKELRRKEYTGELVFLTSFQEYVFEGYHVRALNYLLKPIQYDKIKTCLDIVLSIVNDENYIYRYRDTIIKIPYHNIICISSANHKTEIVTLEGNYIQSEPLRSIIKYLPRQFEQCHRTTIINMQHVLQISGKDIMLSNHMIIPASNTYIENIRAAFIEQIQQ